VTLPENWRELTAFVIRA